MSSRAREEGLGPRYLQARLDAEFPLVKALAIVVESADAASVVLSAPLAPNANHQGTAFGGSLFCVAVLSAWGWLTRHLAALEIDADAVVQESTIRYLVPVEGAIRATLKAPSLADLEKFDRMLQRAARGRIELHVDIHYGEALAARFNGLFVATRS
jgi:thioesterase domain-containing protein